MFKIQAKMFFWLLLLLVVAAPSTRGQRKTGKMYVAIAAPPGEPSFSRAFNKTLANVTAGYLPIHAGRQVYNITLDTIVVELPVNGTFSSGLLERLCGQLEGKHVVAMLLIGDTPAAFTVSQAATYAGIPVLWAKDQGFLTGFSTSVRIELKLMSWVVFEFFFLCWGKLLARVRACKAPKLLLLLFYAIPCAWFSIQGLLLNYLVGA